MLCVKTLDIIGLSVLWSEAGMDALCVIFFTSLQLK